ncbi:MAG: TauD/TfdA family dioxygenase [Pseudomonadota bacterium]
MRATPPTPSALHHSALSPFGVEYTGTFADLSDESVEQIARTTSEHGVVVLRDAGMSDDDFVSLLKRFGPLTFTQGETPLAHRPELNFVTNVNRKTPPRSVFHTDTSYVSEPPAFTALKGELIPTSGGQTVFANQYAAWDSLAEELKTFCRGRQMLHTLSGLQENMAGDETQTWHPLAREHPVTGRTALFLSAPARFGGMEGMSDADGRALFEELFTHSVAEEGLYRHDWRAGDVVLWDNRCTLHKADHSKVLGDRVLHRGMVAGERPIAA